MKTKISSNTKVKTIANNAIAKLHTKDAKGFPIAGYIVSFANAAKEVWFNPEGENKIKFFPPKSFLTKSVTYLKNQLPFFSGNFTKGVGKHSWQFSVAPHSYFDWNIIPN